MGTITLHELTEPVVFSTQRQALEPRAGQIIIEAPWLPHLPPTIRVYLDEVEVRLGLPYPVE
jgi:hypothetical protein